MRKLFYLGLALLVVFELANVYFIMPMPYSQRAKSIDLAYFLYTWRWAFRAIAGVLIVAGFRGAVGRGGVGRWVGVGFALVAAVVVYMANFRLDADRMFLAPESVTMSRADKNVVEQNRLVVGIEINGDARAYPVQFIGYHHQVRDSVGGTPVLVSFCTVCRTGRVFVPVVDGRVETFRLVGMDHFNAMFEDKATGSWWRQANGEAIAGPLTGKELPEVPSWQVTLKQWLALHPNSLIMQPDSALRDRYTKDFDYETGRSRKTLTGTDTASWKDKSWVIGLTIDGHSKAYDWNQLKRERVLNDVVAGTPVVIALDSDTASFFAFERPDSASLFTIRGDSLVNGTRAYALNGRSVDHALKPLFASQEFWHSWRTFQPGTKTY